MFDATLLADPSSSFRPRPRSARRNPSRSRAARPPPPPPPSPLLSPSAAFPPPACQAYGTSHGLPGCHPAPAQRLSTACHSAPTLAFCLAPDERPHPQSLDKRRPHTTRAVCRRVLAVSCPRSPPSTPARCVPPSAHTHHGVAARALSHRVVRPAADFRLARQPDRRVRPDHHRRPLPCGVPLGRLDRHLRGS